MSRQVPSEADKHKEDDEWCGRGRDSMGGPPSARPSGQVASLGDDI